MKAFQEQVLTQKLVQSVPATHQPWSKTSIVPTVIGLVQRHSFPSARIFNRGKKVAERKSHQRGKVLTEGQQAGPAAVMKTVVGVPLLPSEPESCQQSLGQRQSFIPTRKRGIQPISQCWV